MDTQEKVGSGQKRTVMLPTNSVDSVAISLANQPLWILR